MERLFCILLTMVFFTDSKAFCQNDVVLRGVMQVSELLSGPDRIWFGKAYDEYQTDRDLCNLIAKKTKGTHWIVFAGNWCEDTHKLLPVFYKVLDQAKISHRSIQLVFLDRGKNSPEGLENKYNISRLPTFILMQGDEEIGRIVERIDGSIEDEILKLQ